MFGAVLLAGSVVARQVSRRDGLRCAGAAAAGAALQVAVVVAWAVGAGVRLQTLAYAVIGFRSDASRVIATQEAEGATSRISVLLLIFAGTGMLLVVALFAVRLRGLLRHDPVPVVAIAVMLGLDLLGVALSGSFWSPYLFVPLPGLALALACMLAHDHLDRVRHRVTPLVVGFVVLSSIVALVGWTGAWVRGRVPVEVRTGEAIAAAAWPGDRVLVYGGRADIQWASGAQSPYPYLWSLPMRTLDPGLDDLEEVLTGSNPPTWFVEATYINAWSELGTVAIQGSLIRKYEFVRTACGRYRIYHLNTVDPVDVDVDCSTPFRTIWGR